MERLPLLSATCRQQLQCVGCGGQIYWPFMWYFSGPVWPRVALVGRIGIGVGRVGTARHRRAGCLNQAAIGWHEPDLGGER